MLPLLHGSMLNGTGGELLVAVGGRTEMVVDVGHDVSEPEGTSEYW
jgi:hypothetical protein